jgi:hypothetical protein
VRCKRRQSVEIVNCEYRPNSSGEKFGKLSPLVFVLKIVKSSANIVDNELESI